MDPTRLVMVLAGTVVAIGAIISFWGAQLVQTRLNETAEEDVCIGAMFRLYSGSYNTETKELLLVFENRRAVDLELTNLYLFYPEGMETYELNEGLPGNILLSVPVKGVEDGFESGTVKTNCPKVTVDFDYSDVT